jgi:hypothetical protein
MAQSVGPEFKSQYWKKKKKRNYMYKLNLSIPSIIETAWKELHNSFIDCSHCSASVYTPHWWAWHPIHAFVFDTWSDSPRMPLFWEQHLLITAPPQHSHHFLPPPTILSDHIGPSLQISVFTDPLQISTMDTLTVFPETTIFPIFTSLSLVYGLLNF